ncbi:MAG TPA: hypothetical protein D7I11_04275 [Candidatus Poseidoniales archaeon]|nr:hypothetical protein [Euryarchaeota archaeon]DAC54792.1 MAG TPA: hypothetical protein D7I11_04275 [Candidatus Poseidoniales archaeon]
MIETRTAPDLGFENAALRQVSMYDSSNLSSPHLLPRQEPFQPTDAVLSSIQERKAYLHEPKPPPRW